jgi:hypothetical protein
MNAPWEELVIPLERTAWADELRGQNDLRTAKLAIVQNMVCLFRRHVNPDGSLGGFVCSDLSKVDGDTYLGTDVIVGPFVELHHCNFDGRIIVGGDPDRRSIYMVHCAASGPLLFQGEGRDVSSRKQSFHNHDPVLYWV